MVLLLLAVAEEGAVRRVETERRRRARPRRFGRSGTWRRSERAPRRMLLIRGTALRRLVVVRRQEEVWHRCCRGTRVGGVLIRSAVSVRDRLVIRVRRLHVLRLVVRVLRWCGWCERRRQRVRVVVAVLARGRVSGRGTGEIGRPPERRTVRVADVLVLVERRGGVPEASAGCRETAIGWVLQVAAAAAAARVVHRVAVVSVRVSLLLHVRGTVQGLSGVRVVKVGLRNVRVSFRVFA